jgi:hypothetical protein
MVIRDINRTLKTVVRRASPPVSARESSSYTLFHCIYVIFLRPTGCYVMNICFVYLNIVSISYFYYTCELNILGTRIEASVPLSQTGVWQLSRQHAKWWPAGLPTCPAGQGVWPPPTFSLGFPSTASWRVSPWSQPTRGYKVGPTDQGVPQYRILVEFQISV